MSGIPPSVLLNVMLEGRPLEMAFLSRLFIYLFFKFCFKDVRNDWGIIIQLPFGLVVLQFLPLVKNKGNLLDILVQL